MNCTYCQSVLIPGKFRCTTCKHWNVNPELLEDDGETVLLSDARLSEVVRIDIGIFNEVFGDGLAETSNNLIAGPPGAGKTTLFLQFAMAISLARRFKQQPTRETLYIATEQSANELRTTAQRIKIDCLHEIRIVKAMGGLKRDLGDILLQYKPGLIIIDSLTKLVGENLELAVKVAERVKDYTVELKAPSLLVNQVNCDGDHAGLMKLQHAVDALFMLDKDDQSGERFLYSTKNRFGQAPLGVELMMTPKDHPEYPGKLILKEQGNG